VVSVFQHIIHLLLEGLLVYKGKAATPSTQLFADHIALALQELGFHAMNSRLSPAVSYTGPLSRSCKQT
jgi:hypothetical protein